MVLSLRPLWAYKVECRRDLVSTLARVAIDHGHFGLKLPRLLAEELHQPLHGRARLAIPDEARVLHPRRAKDVAPERDAFDVLVLPEQLLTRRTASGSHELFY